MMKKYPILFLIGILIISCSNDDDQGLDICNKAVIINNNLFNATNTDNYTIENIEITGDCLEIEVRAGGCNVESWIIDLVDANRVAESGILQRDLKISLESDELCDAIKTKREYFNLKSLQDNSSNKIILNIKKWNDQITYQY